jgi:hypothetical protein
VTLTVTDIDGNQSVATTTASAYSYAPVTSSVCYLTTSGTLICGQSALNVLSGCYLIFSGYTCPQYGVTAPGWYVSGAVLPGAIGAVTPNAINTVGSVCADPNYALTPWCLDL